MRRAKANRRQQSVVSTHKCGVQNRDVFCSPLPERRFDQATFDQRLRLRKQPAGGTCGVHQVCFVHNQLVYLHKTHCMGTSRTWHRRQCALILCEMYTWGAASSAGKFVLWLRRYRGVMRSVLNSISRTIDTTLYGGCSTMWREA